MKDPLYSQFQESLPSQDTLASVSDSADWNELISEEKSKLARFFLYEAAELLQDSLLDSKTLEEKVTESLKRVELLAPYETEILCQIASQLMHLGSYVQRGRYFLLALDKLKKAEEQDPGFFEVFFEWSHLWGRIYLALARYVFDEEILLKALEKFQKSEKILKKDSEVVLRGKNLYWDWGQTYALIAQRSGESVDLFKAIEKFKEAALLGCDLPHFRIDYGEILFQLGLLQGDTKPLTAAMQFFKEAILICFASDAETTSSTLKKAWILFVKSAKKIAELTGNEEDFRKADGYFHEAVLAVPQVAELWTEWGELYLYHGWLHKNAISIEIALEKLTSSKIPECDPLRVSSLLCEGLILLGVFLEDFKLLKEGQRRIQERLKSAPKNPEMLYTNGLAALALGLYFSDERYFFQAIDLFQKGLKIAPSFSKLWQGLFQSYMSWGLISENSRILQKAISASARLVELHPFSPHYWCQWGVAYLRLYQMEEEEIEFLEEAQEKFKKTIELREDKPDPDWLFYLACTLDLLGDYYGDESYYQRAIELFYKVLERSPYALNAKFHLAITLSHLGEVTGEASIFYEALDLFQAIIRPDEEDNLAWCEWGYALLNLSELISDPFHEEEAKEMKKLAEVKLLKAAQLGNELAYYHLACLYSLSACYEASMKALEKAEVIGIIPYIEDLENDEWLEGVRQTLSFQEFLHKKQSL